MDAVLIILAEPAVASEPGKAALDDPSQAGNLEGALTAFNDLQPPTLLLCQSAGEFLAFMPRVGDDGGDRRKERTQSICQRGTGAAVRNIGSTDPIGDRQADRIDQDVPLSTFHPLEGVEAARSTISVVFTDCPSIITTVGHSLFPARSRVSR
jgi:hypothetical protein